MSNITLSTRKFIALIGILLLALIASLGWNSIRSASANNATQTNESAEAISEQSDNEYDEDDWDEDWEDEDYYEEDVFFEDIANLLNMDVDTLYDEMDAGKSLADIATEQGVNPQVLIEYIVAEEERWIQEELEAGYIDEAEAEEWRAESAAWAAFEVNHAPYDPFKIAQDIIGIDEETLWNELDAGKTGADIAEENGVDPQTLIDAIIAAENAEIDAMLAAGLIDAEEAAEWKTESADIANDLVNSTIDELEADWDDEDCDEDEHDDGDEYEDDDETETAG